MASISALNISGTNYEIVASSALWAKSGTDFSANSINVNGDLTANTINGNELVVNGAARVLGTLYADTIEGKITSAGTADIANSIKANYSNTTLSAGYATATNTAIKVNSAITAQTALHLTATVADNYSALSAGSAKLAGTATSAGQAYSGRWSKADDNTDLDRVLGLGFSDASAQWTAGNEFYRNTVYDKALTFNSKTDTLKSPKISATNITGTVLEKSTGLTSANNLNDVKLNKLGEVAWYSWSTASQPVNAPENGTAVLQVIKKHSGNYVDQNVFIAGVTDYYCHRSCNNGTWTNWVKNVYNPTIPAAANNGTITITSGTTPATGSFTVNQSGNTTVTLGSLAFSNATIPSVKNNKITITTGASPATGDFTLNQGSDKIIELGALALSSYNNLKTQATADLSAKYAISAGAAPVASHQFSAHTSFSTYFSGTSANSALTAKSALSATYDDIGDKISTALTRRKSCYSSNTYSSGYFLLAQWKGGSGTGNHDASIAGQIITNEYNFPNDFIVCVRGNGTSVNELKFYTDAPSNIVATYEIDTADNNRTIIRIYGKIKANWQRFNILINYVTQGDVYELAPVGSSNLTLPGTYSTNYTGTLISRENYVNAKKANSADIARNGNFYEESLGGLPAAFSNTKTYAVNDKVLTGGYAYSAKSAVTAADVWSAVSSNFARLSQVTWTITDTSITELYKGLTIWAKIPSYGGSSGSNATMLNFNNYGAKQVRINNGNYTTHYDPGTIIHMVYDGTYWQIGDRDTDSDNKVRQYNNATTNFRPLLMGYSNNTNPASLTADVTNITYVNSGLYVQPSTNGLYNKGNISAGGTITGVTVSGTTVSATSALVTSAKVNTGNILTAYGSSAKFDSISATNITGTLKSVAPSATSAKWSIYGASDNERPFAIPYNSGSASWLAGNDFYSPMAYTKDILTFNTTKQRLKTPNVSSTTMSSNNYTIENKARMQYNSTDDCIDFLFV